MLPEPEFCLPELDVPEEWYFNH
eukprot:SAG25_NODE_10555_length_329_cov_1.343478_1_plen_22_part_10